MSRLQKEARLHEKVVQEIARQALPKVQGQHTSKEKAVAQRVNIVLVDDLDGTEADETVTFGLDGTTYEIDLSSLNAKKLRHSLSDFIEVARRVNGKRRRSVGKSRVDTKAVREWAKEQGMTVSNRGTLSADVVKAYEAAH